ncbi:hypothetical protein SUGI_1044010 [Cryptomeria japonica]|nr:hypothetical protein SUGI_1044010 [Cryptomeria japonica]
MVLTNFNGAGVGLGFGVGCGFGIGWGFGGKSLQTLGLGIEFHIGGDVKRKKNSHLRLAPWTNITGSNFFDQKKGCKHYTKLFSGLVTSISLKATERTGARGARDVGFGLFFPFSV